VLSARHVQPSATVAQSLQEAGGQLIVSPPKTVKSPRRITLPGLEVDALRAHRAEQARTTLAREPGWTDSEIVLAAPNGGPWWPSNFDRIWRRFKTKQKLEIRFHGPRHTHATQLLKAGVHPKVVSEAPWSRLDRHHVGHVQPYDARHAGRGRREDRRGTAGRTGRLRAELPEPTVHRPAAAQVMSQRWSRHFWQFCCTDRVVREAGDIELPTVSVAIVLPGGPRPEAGDPG
jgi:Phage integrase family